jgi:hypothetical protein
MGRRPFIRDPVSSQVSGDEGYRGSASGPAAGTELSKIIRLPVEDDHLPLDTFGDHLRRRWEREEREIPMFIGFFRKVITSPVWGSQVIIFDGLALPKMISSLEDDHMIIYREVITFGIIFGGMVGRPNLDPGFVFARRRSWCVQR